MCVLGTCFVCAACQIGIVVLWRPDVSALVGGCCVPAVSAVC